MIGIDVGGANLKVVDDTGPHLHYCPLWEGAPLTDLLNQYVKEPDDPAAVVMSGELADCFESKREGISFIVNAVRNRFHSARIYGTDGQFHDRDVPQLAAANWLASAEYLRKEFPDAVLLDIGSTTADIIPLMRFDLMKGLTDLMRLQKGYLMYTGMLRGNIATILQSVMVDGVVTPISSENFAISADAHLVMGHANAVLPFSHARRRSCGGRSANLRTWTVPSSGPRLGLGRPGGSRPPTRGTLRRGMKRRSSVGSWSIEPPGGTARGDDQELRPNG